MISIHAARVGCDEYFLGDDGKSYDFNPRSPSGLRRFTLFKSMQFWEFQSTQPEWAATFIACTTIIIINIISIHAARVGCDLERIKEMFPDGIFQSTQPEWAATEKGYRQETYVKDISIHAARVGCD